MNRSFFEYLGVADSERIHSQTLAWILSEDFKAINADQRSSLLQNIFGLPLPSLILDVNTELDRIDIVIKTDKELIVVENKLKSCQHSDQLSRYLAHCEQNHSDLPVKRFYFLTLINEHPQNDTWINVSYATIYNSLKLLTLDTQNKNSIIFLEYLQYLENLTTIHQQFSENHQLFQTVFTDGGKKKSEKSKYVFENPVEKFIAENQLETIFQISFLKYISLHFGEYKSRVFETRGEAILDIYICRDIKFENNTYTSMIEMQGKAIKFALLINGAENYKLSNPQWVINLLPKMLKLSSENTFGYKKLNPPKSKAYISISKKMEKPYWMMTIQELILYLVDEIKNADDMSKKIIESIK